MSIIINALFCNIILLFPLLIYYIYIAYKKNINKKEKKIVLDISLLFSMYLTLSFADLLNNRFYLIFTFSSLFISLIYKRYTVSILLLSIIIVSIETNNISLILFTIVSYFLLSYFYSLCYIKRTIFLVLNSIITCTAFTISLYNTIDLTSIFILISYIVSLFIIINFLKISKDILNVFMTLKDIQKEKELKFLLFKITHEIKNPLAVVKGYLDMIDTKNKKTTDKYFNIIKSEIKRTLNLLSDFNSLNKIVVTKSLINISDLTKELKDIFIPYFKENKIKYKFDIDNNLKINLDKERIKQVFINIVKNSIEASSPNDKIHIKIYESYNKLYIIIKDTCRGMSKETLENVFNPFYTTKEYGTGLGTYLSKEIIESHGGRLSYNSVLNKGTTASIVLPFD